MTEDENEKLDRPVTARGYKGPKWLIDRIPRFRSSRRDDSRGFEDGVSRNGFVELNLFGNVKPEIVGNGLEIRQPKSVTIPEPGRDDDIAIIRTEPVVTRLSVYEWDNAEAFDDDLSIQTVVDGDAKSEFWLDANAVARADVMHLDTINKKDLDSVDVDIEYRSGWLIRLKKRVHDFKQNRRARNAIRRGLP